MLQTQHRAIGMLLQPDGHTRLFRRNRPFPLKTESERETLRCDQIEHLAHRFEAVGMANAQRPAGPWFYSGACTPPGGPEGTVGEKTEDRLTIGLDQNFATDSIRQRSHEFLTFVSFLFLA